MNHETSKPRHTATITSLVPGRLRLKLHRQSRDAALMDQIKSGLESQGGVHDVRVNTVNGSVTVNYDHKRHGSAGILRWLEDSDVMVESIGHLPSVMGAESTAGRGFIAATDDLNRRLRAVTGVPINLKLVLPLTFVAAGVWSIFRRGLMVEAVPGWLFLWFAFDMFVKLHPDNVAGASEHRGDWQAAARPED